MSKAKLKKHLLVFAQQFLVIVLNYLEIAQMFFQALHKVL